VASANIPDDNYSKKLVAQLSSAELCFVFKTDSYTRQTKTLDGYHFCSKLRGKWEAGYSYTFY